ncbi:polysaccharide deacetylase family protein [Sinorhizobium sp. CCBAU 05631]|uniref:polysaccharide deacetylase family protein n=1 Tax=Sinorhizobium sp. CCBAU 05631 TaxID=794846 RepID=UPI00056C00F6|nr:polysaccharide deacetylase family protein [Sinorhizobium sp. CCBAU 05631]ASY56327.1 Polysaccharide deacetylase [Sinorhizobium sp. CCBAU 05631]
MQAIPILLYHSVSEDFAPAYRHWSIPPAKFKAQMAALAECGYRPMTVQELALLRRSGQPLSRRTCFITFDDGLLDFFEGAMPVLTSHGFRATLFVVSGFVGRTSRWLTCLGEGNRPMLDWRKLRELHGLGIEIGAHTVSHPELDILTHQQATREIQDSKYALEDGLGDTVATFAYPHGYATRTIRRLAEEAGYIAACRVGNALSADTEGLFELSRVTVTSDIAPADLIDLMDTSRLPVAPPADRLIARGWRAARRVRALHRSLARTFRSGGQERDP